MKNNPSKDTGSVPEFAPSKVNFIADPWEYATNERLSVRASAWMVLQRAFRLRLHWLLLWNGEVQILDTFALFNRQLEHWVTSSHKDEGPKSRKSKRALFECKALRIALRRGDGNFKCLADVNEAHVRGNPNFTWYVDGKPNAKLAGRLDDMMGLSPNTPLTSDHPTYIIGDHTKEMKEAFEYGLNPESALRSDFGNVKMPLTEQNALRQLIEEDRWTRSRIYAVLGYGVSYRTTKRGEVQDPLWKYATDNRNVANRLRRLADSCYHRAINKDLRIAARFPGQTLPLSMDLIFPSGTPKYLGIQPQEDDTLDQRAELLSRSAVCLKGDVGKLFEKFAEVSVADIAKLRTEGAFPHYHQLYGRLQVEGELAWNDRHFAREISDTAGACLQALGEICDAPVERVASSGMKVCGMVSGAVLAGIAMKLGHATYDSVVKHAPWLAFLLGTGIHKGVEHAGKGLINRVSPKSREYFLYLGAQLRPTSPSRPALFRCLGDVKTADVL